MLHTQIEILGARERRRRWNLDQKLKIVAETEEPGASVRAVAARHDVYLSLLHTSWRQARRGELVAEPAMRLLPVRVAGVPSAMADVASTTGPAAAVRLLGRRADARAVLKQGRMIAPDYLAHFPGKRRPAFFHRSDDYDHFCRGLRAAR